MPLPFAVSSSNLSWSTVTVAVISSPFAPYAFTLARFFASDAVRFPTSFTWMTKSSAAMLLPSAPFTTFVRYTGMSVTLSAVWLLMTVVPL